MPERRLSPEERALWARVAATVTPLEGKASADGGPSGVPGPGDRVGSSPAAALPPASAMQPPPQRDARRTASPTPAPETLDGGWDRRLRRGAVAPERTIDLHGHTLATAHAALELALARAIADEIRVLLVVTGRPPRADARGRGLIRAGIGDWLAASAWRGRIAAVRHAHPRHGGAGALYLILRRKRDG